MYNFTPEMLERIIQNILSHGHPVQPARQIITAEEWHVALNRTTFVKTLN